MSENPQHRDHLAFVVERMGYDMQQDERRTAEFATPTLGALGQGCVQFYFHEAAHVGLGRFLYTVSGSL